MYKQLVNWCRTHDWGRQATEQDGRIYGLLGQSSEGEKIISLPANFRTIREWARY